MKRTAYNDLLAWKGNKFHKPLLVYGARRTGKTYLVKEFGKTEYEKVIYFNFELNPDYKPLFSGEPEAGRLLREISSLSRVDVTPGNTLLIWDEIQFCPEALDVLPDFVESVVGFDIIVCGFPAASPKAEAKIDELSRTGSIERLRIYPHDFPNRWVAQQYLPDSLVGTKYYEYGDNKTEQAAKAYWDKIKGE